MKVRLIQHGNDEYIKVLDLIKWLQALEEVAAEEQSVVAERAFRVIGNKVLGMLQQFREAK